MGGQVSPRRVQLCLFFFEYRGGPLDGTGHFSRCTLFFSKISLVPSKRPFSENSFFPKITQIFTFFLKKGPENSSTNGFFKGGRFFAEIGPQRFQRIGLISLEVIAGGDSFGGVMRKF